MGKRWPYLLPVAVILILVGLFSKRLLDVEQGADPHVLPSVLLDRPLPTFDLPALPGRANGASEPFRHTDLKGRVALVNVWGSWCIACLQEHPMLMQIAREKVVDLHGIDWRDTPEKGLAWLQKHGDPYDRVGQDPDSKTAIDLGVTGAPETFVVDANGIIRYKHVGPITPEVWEKTLLPLITGLRK